MSFLLRIATRRSQLALWQANYVRAQLLAQDPASRVELVEISTEGDRILDTPLAAAGGKGLFIKELELALLEGRADLAVHSLKDMTVSLPPGLHLGAVCQREDPCDAFVSSEHTALRKLPPGARVGTSSLRRQCQLRAALPALTVETLRGNVPTRLRRLDAGGFDAVILACAGLRRLGLAERIRERLAPEDMLPAPGQGAIAVECRSDDKRVHRLIAALEHRPTRSCVEAERALNQALGGSCQLPLAAYAELEGEVLRLRALVGYPDGHGIVRAELRGAASAPQALGERVAAELIAHGARAILDQVHAGTAE